MSQIDLSDARILKDENPAFEILNGLASLDWRTEFFMGQRITMDK